MRIVETGLSGGRVCGHGPAERRRVGGQSGRGVHANMQRLVRQSFQPTGEGLACEGASVRAIVEHTGTPVYLYGAGASALVGHLYRGERDPRGTLQLPDRSAGSRRRGFSLPGSRDRSAKPFPLA